MNNKQILYYACKYNGEYNKIANALKQDEPYKDINYKGSYICIGDIHYPKVLYDLKYPPYILFYKGDITLLNKTCVSVVGSRNMSDVGRYYCTLLQQNLSKEYVIVSGLAKGIDACIHELSFQNRKTIAIIGCGIDEIYPKENANLYKEIETNHLLLSEYPYKTKPYAHHFPWRNRIIAALSKCVIVVEAKQRSGTLLTVNEAIILNRDVYCFPFRMSDENGYGCNLLIQEGASVLIDNQDVNAI